MREAQTYILEPTVSGHDLFSYITQNIPYATVMELIRLLNLSNCGCTITKPDIYINESVS